MTRVLQPNMTQPEIVRLYKAALLNHLCVYHSIDLKNSKYLNIIFHSSTNDLWFCAFFIIINALFDFSQCSNSACHIFYAIAD